MINIHNIRYGFATNSSSSHSIVMFEGKIKTEHNNGADFGWDKFVLADEKSKKQYVGQLLKDSFWTYYGLPHEECAVLASKWLGIKVDPAGYIDHQSAIYFPLEHGGPFSQKTINREFFKQFLSFVLQDNIAILGGNDNGDGKHPLLFKKGTVNCSKWIDLISGCVARYDETGKFWSLFRPTDGTKTRVSFDGTKPSVDKSETPELVDVKITNQCNAGCRLCYQNSTPNGAHADYQEIYRILGILSGLGVFEIAFGGGEPTLHPRFLQILEQCKQASIVPNFSTSDYMWVVDNAEKLKTIVGGIGYSPGRWGLLEALCAFHAADIHNKITVQIVVGADDAHSLKGILEKCAMFGVGVLLLGWKNCGRGKKGPDYKINLPRVLNSFIKKGCWYGPKLSFDTVLAAQQEAWLKKNSDSLYYTKVEGAHSMYIDAVDNKMGPSSFSPDLVDYDKDIKRYFATI